MGTSGDPESRTENELVTSSNKGLTQAFKFLDRFERVIYLVLIGLLAVVVLFSIVELVYLVFQDLTGVSPYRLENYEFLNLLGFFLLVLIGIELLDTIKAYLTRHEIHVEIIVLLAVIAVCRKIILYDPASATEISLIGMGIAIVGLGIGYYLIKKAGIRV